ncbi:hypothetical protein GXW82_16710 [Streptacidiphilus sp. 4-A2]|nr:hypothetical protein [Streptacidiphilus sp. 4-A2]
MYGHDGIIEGYQTYTYTTKDGSRQVTISANASNNMNIYSAELLAMTRCSAAPRPARRPRRSVANAVKVAKEEAAG